MKFTYNKIIINTHKNEVTFSQEPENLHKIHYSIQYRDISNKTSDNYKILQDYLNLLDRTDKIQNELDIQNIKILCKINMNVISELGIKEFIKFVVKNKLGGVYINGINLSNYKILKIFILSLCKLPEDYKMDWDIVLDIESGTSNQFLSIVKSIYDLQVYKQLIDVDNIKDITELYEYTNYVRSRLQVIDEEKPETNTENVPSVVTCKLDVNVKFIY